MHSSEPWVMASWRACTFWEAEMGYWESVAWRAEGEEVLIAWEMERAKLGYFRLVEDEVVDEYLLLLLLLILP